MGAFFPDPPAFTTLVLGFLDKMHPLMQKIMQSPGFFMSKDGVMGAVGGVVSHLAFGATVGMLYGLIEGKTMPNLTSMDE